MGRGGAAVTTTETYPRETKEPVEVSMRRRDSDADPWVPVTTGVEVALTTGRARPASWAAPLVIDGKLYVAIDALAPGLWKVWGRVADAPWLPVVELGEFIIT
jgi:hypothetical protein